MAINVEGHNRYPKPENGCSDEIIGRPMQYKTKCQFFKALDLIESELNSRFDRPGMIEAAARKDILVNFANCKFSSEDMSKVQLPFDIEKSRLTIALALLGDLTTRNDPFPSVPKVAKFVSVPSGARWYGHILTKDNDDILRRTLDFEVAERRGRGRPNMT